MMHVWRAWQVGVQMHAISFSLSLSCFQDCSPDIITAKLPASHSFISVISILYGEMLRWIVMYGIIWEGCYGYTKVVDRQWAAQLISPEVSKSLCVLSALLFPPLLELWWPCLGATETPWGAPTFKSAAPRLQPWPLAGGIPQARFKRAPPGPQRLFYSPSHFWIHELALCDVYCKIYLN